MLICGVDEVGRGPLIGPVVAAAVILDPKQPIDGLRDSKKLSEKKREYLSEIIIQKAKSYAFGEATHEEIDKINILQASLLAMRRAVLALAIKPERVLIDGNRCPELPYPMEAVIKGDNLIDEIKAASIIAKVKRDQMMKVLHAKYPFYGFDTHKGYPTKTHLDAIERYGVLGEHRKSFKPVSGFLMQSPSGRLRRGV